jgi:TrmH family RNA methyltransferase
MKDTNPEKLTSLKNPKIHHVRKLMQHKKYREQCSEFVVEGIKLVNELSRQQISYLLVSAKLRDQVSEIRQIALTYLVPRLLLERISDTKNTQGVIAVAKQTAYRLEDISPGVWIIAEGLQDPGNLGTIIRTSEAAGASGLIYTEGTVDPFAPKVVRASAGSVLRLPLVKITDIAALRSAVPDMQLLAAVARNGRDYREVKREDFCGIVLGTEGQGLAEKTIALADEKITIPLQGKADSLNVAVTAALLLFYKQSQ